MIWPDRWKWAAAEDPWPRVLKAEQTPSVTHFSGSLHSSPMLETRNEQRELNPVHLKEEVPVSQMTLNIEPKKGRMPEDRRPETRPEADSLVHHPGIERGWEAMSVHWNAPETTHAPLYYEEISLERGGYSRGYFQPIFSGAQFVGTTILLPGLMTIDPPTQRQYELGEARPGSLAPYQVRHPEWTLKAVAVQAAVVTGFAYIIP